MKLLVFANGRVLLGGGAKGGPIQGRSSPADTSSNTPVQEPSNFNAASAELPAWVMLLESIAKLSQWVQESRERLAEGMFWKSIPGERGPSLIPPSTSFLKEGN